MNTSRRGAVIAMAMLAGTLGLSSLMAVSGSTTAVRPGGPVAVASTQILGSLPHASQVRPAHVAVKSGPDPSPSAVPSAQPSATATPRPTSAATEPPSRSGPTPTPWPTPRPVATPTPTPTPPAVEPTQLVVTVYDDSTLIGQGRVAGTTAATASWEAPFAFSVASSGSTLGGGLITVNVTGTWVWNPVSQYLMTMMSNISGSYGCPGNETPFSATEPGPSGSGGSLSSSNDDGVFYLGATCPDGSEPKATFTVTAGLSPGG